MKSEKASKIRMKAYSLNVVKKSANTESMQKNAPNQMGGLIDDMNEKGQECI